MLTVSYWYKRIACHSAIGLYHMGWLALLACALLVSGQAIADENILFAEDTTIPMVLTAPLTQIYAQKKSDVRLYMPGAIAYQALDGGKQRLELSVRTRGVFRRAQCRLPPLRLNFKKKGVKDTLFAGQNKLKLVSPCAANKASQQLLLLEHLAYQAFELVSDKSLKTRKVRMSYVDSDGRKKPWTHLTFLIEDEKELAKRHGMKAIHVPKVEVDQLNAEQTSLVELFQLMIGNTDFSTLRGPNGTDCCHNVQLLGNKNSTSDFYPVPYDFDSSGLVDASYALPADKLPINDVRKRLFRGRCKPDEVWTTAIETFLQKEIEIIGLFNNTDNLDKYHRKKSVSYIQKFFAMLKNPKLVQKNIVKACVG